MKKLCLLLVIFSMFACEQDDNDGVALNEANLQAEWFMVSAKHGSNDYVVYRSNCTSKADHILLAADGVAKTVKYYTSCEESTDNTPATWSLNGKILTFTDSNTDAQFGGEFEVKVLSDYNLSLIQTEILDVPEQTKVLHIYNFKRN